MDFKDLNDHLIHGFGHESKLIRAIKNIHRVFTQSRDDIAELYTPENVAAYSYFYMPTHLPKIAFLLQQLPAQMQKKVAAMDWIDIGCGPATFGLGIRDYFQGECQGHYFGLDQNEHMLSQAKKLWQAYGGQQKNIFRSHIIDLPEEQVLLFGNSINEIPIPEIQNLVLTLKPEIILSVDIGTKEYFHKQLELRNWLLEEGYNIHFPCLGAGTCPLTGTEDWCHQKVFTVHDEVRERLSQIVKLDRHTLPFTACAFSKNQSIATFNGRLLQVLNETKYSFEAMICTDSTEKQKVEIFKKSLGKKESKAFRQIPWGTGIRYKVVKELSDRLRIELE